MLTSDFMFLISGGYFKQIISIIIPYICLFSAIAHNINQLN